MTEATKHWYVYLAVSPGGDVLGTFVSRRGESQADLERLFPTGSRHLPFSNATSAQQSTCRLLERRFSVRRGQFLPPGDEIVTVWGRVPFN